MQETQQQEGLYTRIAGLASKVVNYPLFSHTIIGLILINAIIVGFETYPSLYNAYTEWFYWADRLLLWFFTAEIILKLVASRPTHHYFKDSWNVFDFVIVLSGHLFAGAHFITVLRILRILRLLRAISVIPSLRRIVSALLMTIPALGNIMLLMSILFYIFAVMGTMLFSQYQPDYFGSIQLSLLTLFQVVTLESWASGVMRPLLAQVAWSWIYFVAFILVGTFVIFNLFVGVIVSNVEKVDEEEKARENSNDKETNGSGEESGGVALSTANVSNAESSSMEREIASLKKEITELKELIVQLHHQKK